MGRGASRDGSSTSIGKRRRVATSRRQLIGLCRLGRAVEGLMVGAWRSGGRRRKRSLTRRRLCLRFRPKKPRRQRLPNSVGSGGSDVCCSDEGVIRNSNGQTVSGAAVRIGVGNFGRAAKAIVYSSSRFQPDEPRSIILRVDRTELHVWRRIPHGIFIPCLDLLGPCLAGSLLKLSGLRSSFSPVLI
jgi:hypothetical protein